MKICKPNLAAVILDKTADVSLLATANATSEIKGGELPYKGKEACTFKTMLCVKKLASHSGSKSCQLGYPAH